MRAHSKTWLRFVVASLMWLAYTTHVWASASEELHTIRYPNVIGTQFYQIQASYFIDVLKLALEKSGMNYQIVYVDIPSLAQSRSQSLIKQQLYDLHWLTTNNDRESQLKPIRIPLYRGLLGLRIAFVHADNTNLFAKTNTLAELNLFYSGQGRDWMDSKVLKFHKIKLIEASSLSALYEMLKINRINYMPRSILEIWWESELPETSGLSIDPYIALHYPEPVYFFVRNDDTVLYEHVLKGLNIAIDDGTFQQNFERYYGEYIRRSELDKRRIFRLTNPFIPPETPLNDSRLWYEIPTQ